MSSGRLHRFLSRFTDVRPDEARAAFYFFLYFFLITFPAYIIKPVKDNLLIHWVKPGWWAYADLITAALIGFVVALNARLLNKLPRRQYLSAVMFFFIYSLFVFWFIFDFQTRSVAQTPIAVSSGFGWQFAVWMFIRESWPWPIIFFCFWADVFVATSVTQFWLAVNDVFYTRQAKRMVGFFVSGGLLGGIGGALTTFFLVRSLGQETLLLVCLGILFLTLMAVNLIYSERKKLREGEDLGSAPAAAKVGYLESFRTVRKERYLRILAAVLASSMIVASLINFQFKIVLKASIGDSDARAAFIGVFLFGVLVVSAIFHILTTDRVLKSSGIRPALLLAPLFLLAGSLSVFAIPAAGLVVWGCFLRGSDKVFDSTLNQSARELLYIPVSPAIKYKSKIFVDMFVNKFAIAFGAVLFLILYHAFRFEEKIYFDPELAYLDIAALLDQVRGPIKVIGVPVLLFAAVWIFFARLIHKEYVALVGKDIASVWKHGETIIDAHVDVDQTRRILDILESREKSRALYIQNLYDLLRRKKLTPEVAKIISSRIEETISATADELKAHSMDSALDVGGEVFFRGVEDTLSSEDFETQIREIVAFDSFKHIMEKHLLEIVADTSGDAVKRMEAAKLVGLMDMTPEVQRILESLLKDPSPDVRYYALSSAAVHRRQEHLPLIIRQLGSPLTEQAAQDAVAAYGPGAVEALERSLHDARESPAVRKAVPEILSRLGTQDAVDILIGELALGDERLEPDLVEALRKIRAGRSAVLFSTARLKAKILALIRESYDVVLEPDASASPGESPEAALLRKARLDLKIKRIFDLLTLVHSPDDIVKSYQNIVKGTQASVDRSLELLDNILDRDCKTFLFPLIEGLPPEEKRRRLKKLKKALEGRSS